VEADREPGKDAGPAIGGHATTPRNWDFGYRRRLRYRRTRPIREVFMTDRLDLSRSLWVDNASAWRLIGLRFVPLLGVLSLTWEVAHLSLYTIWKDGSPGQLAFAVVHCTIGDVAIGVSSLLLVLIVLRAGPPENWGAGRTIASATVISVMYTVFSEWINADVRGSWVYSSRMPVLPVTGTGLSPLLQWLAILPLSLGLALRGFGKLRGCK
jgi:hypothetical protein